MANRGPAGVVAASHHSPAPARGDRLARTLPLLLRYAVAGGLTYAIYLGAFIVALQLVDRYFVAICIAQVVAIAFAFPVYRNRVFRADGPLARQFVAFLGVWWVGAALSLAGVPLLVETTALGPLPAQLVVLVGVVGFSFLGHRRLTFGQSSR